MWASRAWSLLCMVAYYFYKIGQDRTHSHDQYVPCKRACSHAASRHDCRSRNHSSALSGSESQSQPQPQALSNTSTVKERGARVAATQLALPQAAMAQLVSSTIVSTVFTALMRTPVA